MPTFAFSSEDDFRRAARAILRSEHTPQNRPGRRSRYPVATGGGGPRPYIVTDTGYTVTDTEEVIQIVTYDGTVAAKPLKKDTSDAEPSDDDDTVFIGVGSSPMCVVKGSLIWVSRLNNENKLGPCAISGGIGTRLKCSVDDDIESESIGFVSLTYETLFQTDETKALAYNATGKIVTANQTVIVDLFQCSFTGIDSDGNPTLSRLAIVAVIDCADTNQTVG